MTRFIDALREGMRTSYCSQVTNQPEWFSNLRRIVIPEDIRNFADNVNRRICDKPIPEEDFPESSFSGGQCDTLYNVTYQIVTETYSSSGCSSTQVGGGTFTANDLQGPIEGASLTFTGQLSCGPETANWIILHNGGETIVRQSVSSFYGRKESGHSIEILSVARVDGLPDDCGDSYPVLPPQGPITTNIDIDYGDTNEFNLAVPVIFAPVYVALDGSLNFNFDIPEINLSGTVNLTNDFEISLDFSGNKGRGVTDDTEPVPTPEEEEDDPGEPEPGDASIVGVFVYAISLNRNRVTVIPQNRAPSIVAPRVASVKFLIKSGDDRAWTSDIPVKSVRSYIACPAPLGAIDVKVTPDFGSNVIARPHYSS